ncbi:MAG: hypothetical protein RJA10_1272 [Pseudomonadota bacterium]|jgi:hypothetical protein
MDPALTAWATAAPEFRIWAGAAPQRRCLAR